ncbi:MAG: HlyD family efflux transporter periplasmic adaptor subunit [Ferruginibacter sp.]
MKKYSGIFTYSLLAITLCVSCRENAVEENTTEGNVEMITPVTITQVSSGPMEDYIDLNATSAFQQRWIIKSNVTGYLQQANIQLNKFVHTGQPIFTVKTKEASSIGNTISILDSSFKFTGVNTIRSNGTGFISEINHQVGDYVQDGEQLAVITDTKSFVFVMDMPYELRQYVIDKNFLELHLPDGEILSATVSNSMPVMDSAAQTQRIALKVNATHTIPENLVAKVRLVKQKNNQAIYLPRAAVLSNETQSSYWVMKLLNDSIAVKVEIKKGMETKEKIEISSPIFSEDDRIILKGNYGLPDTAKIIIEQKSHQPEK